MRLDECVCLEVRSLIDSASHLSTLATISAAFGDQRHLLFGKLRCLALFSSFSHSLLCVPFSFQWLNLQLKIHQLPPIHYKHQLSSAIDSSVHSAVCPPSGRGPSVVSPAPRRPLGTVVQALIPKSPRRRNE